MSTSSISRHLLPLALAAAGCFGGGVIATGRGPIVIDTFEDMTKQPQDSRFSRWQFTTFSADPATSQAVLAQPGFESNWCLQVDWQVTDPPNGAPNYPGFVARTQAVGSVDLTGYTTFSFSHLYRNDGPCLSLQVLTVNLHCWELNSSFTINLETSPTWKTASLSLADFVEGFFPPPNGTKREHCLGVVDEVQISTLAQLGDGQCSSGTLLIDDVSIR